MNELNKKLTEWVGISPMKLMIISKGEITYGGFTQSLDACFKWLVPKVIDTLMAEQECSSDLAYAILFNRWLLELQLIIPESALALCLAIEKLIDGEK